MHRLWSAYPDTRPIPNRNSWTVLVRAGSPSAHRRARARGPPGGGPAARPGRSVGAGKQQEWHAARCTGASHSAARAATRCQGSRDVTC